MKIAIVSSWYSENMGYIENRLPVALADLGNDVHVVASDGQVYYTMNDYDQVYGRFLGPRFVDPSTRQTEGVTLHRLPHFSFKHLLGIRGLVKSLAGIRPDVVQVMDHVSFSALQSAYWCTRNHVPLFTASHMHASAFKPLGPGMTQRVRMWAAMWFPGRLVSRAATACYTISADASDIAQRFLGVEPHKIRRRPLGVDAKVFHPASRMDAQRTLELRSRWGFAEGDTVCIYTGRLTEDKDPLVLARAIAQLRGEGHPFRGLFVGEGPQQSAINRLDGNLTISFAPFHELADLYRASDIGVWPRQESTSMLDAGACGLPLVVSDRVQVRERVDEGGTTYAEGNSRVLAERLLSLQDPDTRLMLGSRGSLAIREALSWDNLARSRVVEYEAAIKP